MRIEQQDKDFIKKIVRTNVRQNVDKVILVVYNRVRTVSKGDKHE